ncbi:MAG: glycosyltransferase involved in cell wall biosynthesis [Halioglobus sp.]|jgi:glycosyltransferase involved in cell wall biosynthesis
MKKLLFVTPELPYPAQSGGKVKSLKLLASLTERFDVTLACPLKMEDPFFVEDFHKVSGCSEHMHEEIHVPRSPRNLVLSYLRGIPLNVHRTLNTQLKNRIATVADQYDIIFLDHYEVYPYVPQGYDGLTIYHAHNAYFKMWQRFAELPGNPAMRLAAYFEACRVRKSESNVAKACDITFAAPNDAAELIAEGVPEENIYNTFHLGDDRQLDLPDLCYSDTKKKLMYVGFLGWEPNSQGLIWFVEKVWPLLEAKHPELTFDIVGKNPDERLQGVVERCANITLHGFVPDLQEIYRDSRVSVAPLLFGSGMKVKVLDSMARGMPTVTTTVGAEGIEIEEGQHLLVADHPAAMADRVDDLLTDPVLWQRLQVKSRELIKERYTWQQLFKQMHATIDNGLRAQERGQAVRGDGRLQHVG